MKLTPRSSIEDQAHASIWQHCVVLSQLAFGGKMAEEIQDLTFRNLRMVYTCVLIFIMPISFPVIAYLTRQEARQALTKFRNRSNISEE